MDASASDLVMNSESLRELGEQCCGALGAEAPTAACSGPAAGAHCSRDTAQTPPGTEHAVSTWCYIELTHIILKCPCKQSIKRLVPGHVRQS